MKDVLKEILGMNFLLCFSWNSAWHGERELAEWVGTTPQEGASRALWHLPWPLQWRFLCPGRRHESLVWLRWRVCHTSALWQYNSSLRGLHNNVFVVYNPLSQLHFSITRKCLGKDVTVKLFKHYGNVNLLLCWNILTYMWPMLCTFCLLFYFMCLFTCFFEEFERLS